VFCLHLALHGPAIAAARGTLPGHVMAHDNIFAALNSFNHTVHHVSNGIPGTLSPFLDNNLFISPSERILLPYTSSLLIFTGYYGECNTSHLPKKPIFELQHTRA